jgi:hypothetical protein
MSRVIAAHVRDRRPDIPVRQHDARPLATELEGDLRDVPCCELRDAPPGDGRARERDQIEERMCRERLADDRSPTGHQVEHARWQPDLVDDLGEDVDVERRHRARLEDDGAAGGERRRDLERGLVERVVPWDDEPHDADRLVRHHGVRDPLLGRGLVKEIGRFAEDVDRHAVLHDLGDLSRRPDLADEEIEEGLAARGQPVRDPAHRGGALGRQHGGPTGLGVRGRPDGAVHVVGRRERDPTEQLFGRWIDDVSAAVALRRNPRAIEVDRVASVHGRSLHHRISRAAARGPASRRPGPR